MTTPNLIGGREMRSRPFLRDLGAFLSQPEDLLRAVAELADGQEGFVGDRQHRDLTDRFGVTAEAASAILRIADYLYGRASSLRMGVAEAVVQIEGVASRLESPVSLDEERLAAIAAILSFKRDYEQAIARGKATSTGPHFTDINGSWAVNVAELANGETIRFPILSLTVSWHDGTGSYHEAFVRMLDEDWERLNEQLKTIADGRSSVGDILGL